MTHPTIWTRPVAIAAVFVLGVIQMRPSVAEPMQGPSTAHRVGDQCGESTSMTGLWKHCGEFPTSLPIRWSYNTSTLPSAINATTFRSAIESATEAWNLPMGEAVFTLGGTTTKTKAKDGVNTIMFGNPAQCGQAGARAVACIYYEGTSQSASHRIVEADVILDISSPWAQFSGTDETLGVVVGSAFEPVDVTGNSFDLQSVVTHEIGHALGLEDIGGPNPAWPSRASDAGKHLQTMYFHLFAGATHMRTLDAGDILGLQYVLDNT